ncbi:MAG: MATE family efflux transporter [Eubacteriales bacterium]|nr:MATE family efflux transporter [Eubacteriales bacterium]
MIKNKNYFFNNEFKILFIPATIGLFSEFIRLIIDETIIGILFDEIAFAGINLVEPYTIFVAFISYLICSGVASLMEREYGKNDKNKADEFFSLGMILAISIGIIITIIMIINEESFIQIVASNSQSIYYVREYFKYIKFIPVIIIVSSLMFTTTLYRGGKVYCIINSISLVILNSVLSIFFGKIMGIKGIAIATLLSYILSLIPFIVYYFTKNGKTSFIFNFDMKNILSIFKIGSGEASQFLYISIFELILNLFLLKNYGDNAVIIGAIIINILFLFISIFEGITEFLIVCENIFIGESNANAIKRCFKYIIKAGIIESIIVFILIQLLAPIFPSIIGIDAHNILNDAIIAIRIFSFSAIPFMIVRIFAIYYLYINKIFLSHYLFASSMLIFPVFLIYLCKNILDINYIWISITISPIISIILLLIYIKIKNIFDKNKFYYPLYLENKSIKKSFSKDIKCTKEGIESLCILVETFLIDQKISIEKIKIITNDILNSQLFYANKSNHKEAIICNINISNEILLYITNTNVLEQYNFNNTSLGKYENTNGNNSIFFSYLIE